MLTVNEIHSLALAEVKANKDLCAKFKSMDYFLVSCSGGGANILFAIDEVSIKYGTSEGIYADFIGRTRECYSDAVFEGTHIFTLKTLDESPSGFKAVCELAGAICEIVEKILTFQRKKASLIKESSTSLDTVMNDIFLNLQKEMGIQARDVNSDEYVLLQKAKDELSELIATIVMEQSRKSAESSEKEASI